jgi:hypothetical protein
VTDGSGCYTETPKVEFLTNSCSSRDPDWNHGRGWKPGSAAAGDRPESQISIAGVAEKHRPTDLRLHVLFPSILKAIIVVKPRPWSAGIGAVFWPFGRWKSRRRGRSRIKARDPRSHPTDEQEEPIGGARRIHSELLMLGIEVAESTVARYMTRRQGPALPGLEDIPAQSRCGDRVYRSVRGSHDLVKLLYGLVLLRHARRRLVSVRVTNNPTAEWIAGQVTDAFPWDEAPRHLIRDLDGAFGPAFTRRIRAMGSEIALRRHARRGRTVTLSGWSDRYVANHSTT